MEKPAKREQLASRLGFLLISAGCAIGLGNVWRFPFITGEYGGACFLLLFIVCQLMVMPVMICEFAIGRASRLNLGMALGRLEPAHVLHDHLRLDRPLYMVHVHGHV